MSNDRVKLTAEQRTALETGRCHFTHVIERLVNLGLATPRVCRTHQDYGARPRGAGAGMSGALPVCSECEGRTDGARPGEEIRTVLATDPCT